METKPDYDAMYRKSQNKSYSQDSSTPENEPFEHTYLQKGEYPRYENETVQPEVLDQNGQPLNKPRGFSSDMLSVVSLIIAVVSFVLIFVGMFAHFVLWLNILICLTGIGFGIAVLLSKSSFRVFGIIGIIIAIFDLIVDLICMIVLAIGSGISAISGLLT